MRRRHVIALMAGAAAWPLAARAQQSTRLRTIGVLSGFSNPRDKELRFGAFQQQLQALGWIDGRNIKIDYREAGDPTGLDAGANALVATGPDVILAMPSPATQAVFRATRSIPIVFGNVSDPIERGLVASFARPGGNATGFTAFEYSLGGKWLELLREFAPTTRRVLVLYVEQNASLGLLRSAMTAGTKLGIDVTPTQIRKAEDIQRAFQAFGNAAGGGLLTPPHPILTNNMRRIFELAVQNRMPAVHPFRNYALNGGLVSYGSVEADAYRGAADYVDRILKGAKPGDLPVQNPTRFEMLINLKAARAIGLDVPASLLLRADEVIE
jgi:putative ABC transport system substrate-binding protein